MILGPATHGRPEAGVFSSAFVGRTQLLARLWTLTGQRPSVVLVEGPAGIGKSRLVAELHRRMASTGIAVLMGHCAELREPSAYGPILDALRDCAPHLRHPLRLNPVAGDLRTVLPELAGWLPKPVGVPTPDTRRHRLFRAVRELLAGLGPAQLVVEDVHWADDETVNLLRFLASNPPPDLSMIITYRREDLRARAPLGTAYTSPVTATALTLRLKALDAEHTGLLATSLLGMDGVGPEFTAQLHEMSGGIPYVIGEIVRSLPDPATTALADATRARELLTRAPVPLVLRTTIAGRLARASAAARRVLDAAAVLNVPATAETLVSVTELPENVVHAALIEAGHRDLLVDLDPARYGFRHELARRAVYDCLGQDERRELHARCGRVLADRVPRPLVQLAEHARHAGEVGDWLRYGEAAADRAAAAGDMSLAATLLRDLLTAPGLSATDVDRLAVKLGKHTVAAVGPPDIAGPLFTLVSHERLSPSVRGQVRFSIACRLLRSGHIAAGRAELESLAAELRYDSNIGARCVAVLMLPYNGTASLPEVAKWRDLAETCLRRTSDEDLMWFLRANILATRVIVGEPSAVAEVVALEPATDVGSARRHIARLYSDCADAASVIGRLPEARLLMNRRRRWADDAQTPYLAAADDILAIRTDWFNGNWDGLAERARTIRDRHHAVVPAVSEASLVLGWLATTRGRWAEAERHLVRARTHNHRDAVTSLALSGHGALIRSHLGRADVGTACHEADQAMRLLRAKGIWAWGGEMIASVVDAYTAGGRIDDARAAARETEAGIRDRDAPFAAAAVHAAHGRIAARTQDTTAAAHFQRAYELYQELSVPYFAALVVEASALDHHMPPDRALATLSEATEVFATLGAAHDENRCLKRIHALGGSRPKRKRNRTGSGQALSPREVTVGRLVATGLTNRQIATQLSVSLRTVEHHVLKVMRKLDLGSRRDLRPWHFDKW